MIDFVCMPPHIEAAGKCRILNLFAEVGACFDRGEILFAYEYDGAFFEERAVENGKVRAVLFKKGDLPSGNTPIIVYEKVR
jgi:hypothetical protein